MRFKVFSQSAVQNLWDKWKYTIHSMLDEFNEDVFDGVGFVRENYCWECLYLVLETNHGCLYIFPLPGVGVALRLYRKRIDKVNPALMAPINQPDQDNLLGGLRVPIEDITDWHARTKITFQNELAEGLKWMYREYWLSLLY